MCGGFGPLRFQFGFLGRDRSGFRLEETRQDYTRAKWHHAAGYADTLAPSAWTFIVLGPFCHGTRAQQDVRHPRSLSHARVTHVPCFVRGSTHHHEVQMSLFTSTRTMLPASTIIACRCARAPRFQESAAVLLFQSSERTLTCILE